MKRLTCSQVVATVFALGWAACPMVFAAERGKQVVRQEVTDKLARVYGRPLADSLVGQLRAMHIGHSAVDGSTTMFQLSGSTYVFAQMAPNAIGGTSGIVTEYNSDGERVADYNIANVATPDDNRINFSISASTPDMNWVEDGALVGIPGDPGNAVALISVDGGDSRLSLVNFNGLAVSDSQIAAPSLLTIMQFPTSDSTQGGVAGVGEICLVTACAIVVVAVVVTVFCLVVSMLGSLWSCY